MRPWKVDFGKPKTGGPEWYCLYADWGLIEASFAQQYGIRLRHEDDMPWSEFATLLAGIKHDTPLGRIIELRSETNKDNLKNFTQEQRKIRSDWQRRLATKLIQDPEEAKKRTLEFQAAMKAAFYTS